MNKTQQKPEPLDTFESALLTELREVVAERAAASPTTVAPRSRQRWLTGVAAAAVLAVGGLATTQLVSPDPAAAAFEVRATAGDDIVIEVNRFEDADGLEAALADHGITADVEYDPELWTEAPAPEAITPDPDPGNDPGALVNDVCAFNGEHMPWQFGSSDTEIVIPADSSIRRSDSILQIGTTTTDSGHLGLQIAWTVGGHFCMMGGTTG